MVEKQIFLVLAAAHFILIYSRFDHLISILLYNATL